MAKRDRPFVTRDGFGGRAPRVRECRPSTPIGQSESARPVAVRARRKSPAGRATNDLTFSAYVGTNDVVFPYVLSLYVRPGCRVADVTYGRGVFWRNVPDSAYQLMPSDISAS